MTATGKLKYNKVYSKRSKNWKLETVKEPKTYDFWPTKPLEFFKRELMMMSL